MTYDQLIALVDQLSTKERQQPANGSNGEHRELTPEEKKAIFDSMILHPKALPPDFSLNRADWYGDDGR